MIVGLSVSLPLASVSGAGLSNHLSPHYPRLTNGGYHHGPGPLRHEPLNQASRLRVHRSLWRIAGLGPGARATDTPEDSHNESLHPIPVFHVIEPRPLWS
jgi:hypothetical protein